MPMRWWILTVSLGCNGEGDVVIERDALKNQVTDLEARNARLEREAQALNAQVRRMDRELVTLRQTSALRSLGIQEGGRLSARLQTSKGAITCELFPDKAPNTVVNFVELAEGSRSWTDPATKKPTTRPLYNGTVFHRVIPSFMIQGGDPLGTGLGGPGYEFADESQGHTFSEPGLLAMANSGPNTNGSQFFVTDRATPHHLDGKHTIFGKCGNLDVVQAIAEAERDENDTPLKPIVLQKVQILREGPKK
jgi:peptidyl-prolyl cis-trans isomerase A (cyclophilin A)